MRPAREPSGAGRIRLLVDGGNPGSGGYHQYLRGLFAAPPPPDFAVTLLASPQLLTALGPLDPAVRVVSEPMLWAPTRQARRGWWRRAYPALVRVVRPDLVFHPNGIVRGDPGAAPTVAVHHNISPFAPETYRAYGASTESAANLLLRARFAHSFRRANGVVFHVEYTRDAVSRQVPGIRRTALVPNAVPHGYLAAPPRAYPELERPGRPVRILCVSTLYLTKHQENVVDAVADLRAELGQDLQVAFVGGGEPRARARLAERVAQRRATGFTTLADSVPTQAMPGHYAQADLFVFPSCTETWPITLLEAMAAGLPIACSNRMAMPQLLGDAGVYLDPHRPDTIAAALRELLLAGAPGRREYGQRARARAAGYPWSRSRAQLFAFLREVAADGPVDRVPARHLSPLTPAQPGGARS